MSQPWEWNTVVWLVTPQGWCWFNGHYIQMYPFFKKGTHFSLIFLFHWRNCWCQGRFWSNLDILSSLTGKSKYPDSKIIAAEGDKDEFKVETIKLLPHVLIFFEKTNPWTTIGCFSQKYKRIRLFVAGCSHLTSTESITRRRRLASLQSAE